MIAMEQNVFHSFLSKHDDRQWADVVECLMPPEVPVMVTGIEGAGMHEQPVEHVLVSAYVHAGLRYSNVGLIPSPD